MEFQSSDEEAAYRERFARQAQNADPVSKIQFEAWYAAAWEDARGYFDQQNRPRQYMPRGPVDQAPAEIAEAFRAWEKYVEKDGVIPTRLSIFEAGRAAGMGTLEQFRREFSSPDEIELELGEHSFTRAQAAAIEEYVQGRIGAFQNKERDADTTNESERSEFGRGYEAGEASANDRALRTVALGHAVDLAKMGNIQLLNGNGATISFGDPLSVAKSFYEFLAGV